MTATPAESEAMLCRERLEEISAYYFQTSLDLQHQLDDERKKNAMLTAENERLRAFAGKELI